MFNCVIISGRITADLELKSTSKGDHLLKFNIANETGYGDNKQTNFFHVTAWGKTAETIERYFGKGSMIGIEGELRQSTFTSQGTKREEIYINAYGFQFMGDSKRNSSPAQASPPRASVQQGSAEDFTVITDDDDLPF